MTLNNTAMKTINFFITILIVIQVSGYGRPSIDNDHSVNAIVNDISFVQAFGIKPTTETDEQIRLKTHLEYIENLLRNRDISSLTDEQKTNRAKILDLLHDYWTIGMFPRNYEYSTKRAPCFIDKDGSICAVGYLVEKTAGRQVAEAINSKYKYEYVMLMNDKTVDEWIEASGLTKEECAMIQPTYGYYEPDNYVSTGYGISSAVFGGLNLSFNTINGVQMAKGTDRKAVAITGLFTGAGQFTLGALSIPNQYYPAERNLSFFNIGFGLSTMILSSWNLISNRKPRESSLSWNMYSTPTFDNRMTVGFRVIKRL